MHVICFDFWGIDHIINHLLVIFNVNEITFDSDLSGEMANSWCIELDPSLHVTGVGGLNDDVGAQVLRKGRVVCLSVSRVI